ncbi:MAG TPA: FG-GAP-like repeat-containing protein, partial [Acidobacteriota bacterium]|nr:FG-GAP-like repeat-containing protein [Acidobacteriota bacterium]
MSSLWQDLLKVPAAFLEAGVMLLDSSTRLLQTGIGAVTGKNGDDSLRPPLDGPRGINAALSDLANQIVRVGYITPLGTEDILAGLGDILRTARRSFGYRDLSDPRILALPFELPLSAGSLIADALMKLMVVYSAAGSRRLPSLMNDALELFSDTPVFMTLRYKDLIERYRERLKRNPGDSETRLQLGRMYVKCGMFDQAVKELGEVTKTSPASAVNGSGSSLGIWASSTWARAYHELLIAHYRAGRFEEACRAGVQAMIANPKNERARGLLWLASKSLGAYPASVPAEYRMEVKAGYERPGVLYENIAPKLGLDKTIAGRGTVVFDYNNDGLLDIAIAGQHGGCNLYRNNGDGTFTDVSVGSGLDECYEGFALVAGDYDNDGNVDLFVTRLGFYHGEGVLFHNNRDGTFTARDREIGLDGCWGTMTANFADTNNDGYL